MDACAQPAKVKEIAAKRPNTVAISAVTGEGIEQLLELIEDQLSKQLTDIHCLVPYSKVLTLLPRNLVFYWEVRVPYNCHVSCS